MAKLISEEINCSSTLEILPGTSSQINGKEETEIWQNVKVILTSGENRVTSLNSDNCSLCRTPKDEIKHLGELLEGLLAGKSSGFSFEPNEPSFELNFGRSHHESIKVEAWIDSGNAATGFYTWDACGIRFFTTEEALKQFLLQLKAEFNLLL